MKRIGLILVAFLLPLLTGCVGPSGVPLPERDREPLALQFEELDRVDTEDALRAQVDSYKTSLAPIADKKDSKLRSDAAQYRLLIGYCWERLGQFDEAVDWYKQVRGSDYESVAYMRIVQVAEYMADERPPSEAEVWRKEALTALERCTHYRVVLDSGTGELRGPYVLMREPPVGTQQPGYWLTDRDILAVSRERVDGYYRDRLIYRIFDFLVTVCSPAGKNASYVLAILVLAVLAKLITTPLSAAQFRSMQAMQRLQPELKKLQAKYKDDKQQMAKAQMDLFKEHKINPLSSCLPMLIQMPILIWVYYGIRYFVYRFQGIHFLYIQSLGNPDVVALGGHILPGPLLLLYGVSMYFSQRLIATPAATPEQQQQQKLMAYMMPVMLVVILKDLPAAFILYWFLQNMLMTGHQYLIMRSQRPLAVAAATTGGSADEAQVQPSEPAGPPKEAMDRITQGTGGRKKKRKRK
ncbi:MAG: membrane protein insertase YidC [Armatimonadetes bacterium]|nr:membrane protein insertase YidC [Armatimonadota bacterium]